MLGYCAFRMPATAIKTPWETIEHSSAIAPGGSMRPRATRVDRNHGGGNAELFPADAMMWLGIVRSIPEESVDRQVTNGLRDRGNKVRCVIARPVSNFQRGNQVAGMMRNECDFWEAAELLHPAGAGQEVSADVVALQSRRVDRSLRTLLDQAALTGNTENSGEESLKSPFFRSRSCAF